MRSVPDIARELLAHALPVLVAQLASIGMMVVDTAVLGHASAVDLAAVAIGGGIQVSIVFALVGVLQALSPLVAHAQGAGREAEAGALLQQGFWLAWLLSLPGMLALHFPDPLLALSPMPAEVEAKVRAYLATLAWAMPASLTYRSIYAFCNGIGRARLLVFIGLANLLLHALLAWGFALHGWLGVEKGAVGCATSNALISWLACFAALTYLLRGPLAARYGVLQRWRRPNWATWRALLHLGLPMGVANFVEISAFTLMALFVAPLGAEVLAGHRIVASLSALTYMVPLSLAIATLSAVGQALGAGEPRRASRTVAVGIALAGGVSLLVGAGLWAQAEAVSGVYTDAVQVRSVATALVAYVAVYQFFDAIQTIAGYALRAYRVTFLPMLVQLGCFWGVGLGGGWYFAYRATPPWGVSGFWLAATLSLVAAAGSLTPLLAWVIRQRRREGRAP
ncbi:MAG: hypothetical protein RIR00_2661 [Pseudomonadota bacterium]